MGEHRNETSEPSKVGLTILWASDDIATLERAADALSTRDHGDYTKTDIIRMGARRFAAEILGEAA